MSMTKINNPMCYVREQEHYHKDRLKEMLSFSDDPNDEKIGKFLSEMKRKKAIKQATKAVKASRDYQDQEEEENIPDTYCFTFVGLIAYRGRILMCYPKYIKTKEKPREELREVFLTLSEWSKRKGKSLMSYTDTEGEDPLHNPLGLYLYLIDDYYENGIYTNTENIIECNGTGEILWDRTVAYSPMLLQHGRPYYVELQTRRSVVREHDYIQRLHEYILTEVCRQLEEWELLDFLSLDFLALSEECIDDFGGEDTALYHIEKELAVQFSTRKQRLLKAMHTFLKEDTAIFETESAIYYGTNAYHDVWEDVCATVLGNCLETPLRDLFSRKRQVQEKFAKLGENLLTIIERPLWTYTGKRAKTYIPDIVTIDGDSLYIYDAKYYTPKLEEGISPSSQPGIESVGKQFCYELAYRDFMQAHGLRCRGNYFLLPTESDEHEDRGSVRMEMFECLGLQRIQVIMLSARKVYQCYLQREKLSMPRLACE